MAGRPVLGAFGILCLLASGCSEPAEPFAGDVLRMPSACMPSPAENSDILFTPGSIVIQAGETLSDVTVEAMSPTNYSGDFVVYIVDSDEFSGGVGIPYEESMGFRSLPSTVSGPGEFWIALVVEVFPEDDTISFTNVNFKIDGTPFVSTDQFDLEIRQGGC